MRDKIQQLRTLIRERLTPIITHDYRYLMMCDHQNVGDSLIMKGELDFLSTIKNAKCKEYTTMWSFKNRQPSIPKDDLLIMRGSGSFGDIWPTAPNFWKFVMKKYPENPILFMPQTIHFNNEQNLNEMAELINKHKKITLCLRDNESFAIAQKYFHCDSYLVPDMAFYMNTNFSLYSHMSNSNKTLLVKREDKESKTSPLIDNLSTQINTVTSDWPTFNIFSRVEKIKQKLFRLNLYRTYDLFIRLIYNRYIIKHGINFLKPFSKVYATRMHAGILAMMMGKETVFFDNNYGKIRKLYETWLYDTDNVYLEF
ncbi:MAG: polysaccharide pyruvyl transferase family protein [Fibrobacter sp.]|uniref:polysaccharide pyruvyl transferase family protein n=1 Tax=Fibrobacter sp. TaxID=35828 RepID=UPI0025B853E0|nr:polysaccharide pyruvyl transferase family protein [Fibrobacter sp.]MBQ7079375.1 polysaccharide pyruvyl transferase family protein [Fibrobacter sp.]